MRALLLLLFVCLAGCGPKSMEARMRTAEKRADSVNRSLDLAEKAENDLDPKEAESNLEDAKKGLMDPDINLHPELEMMVDRFKELQSKLDATKAAREKRDLELRLEKARDKVVPAVQKLSEALDKLSPSAPTKDQISAVEDQAKDVREGVDDAKDMFVKDPAFASWAKSQRAKSEKALDEVTKAKAKLRFIETQGQQLADAQAKVKESRTEKDLDDKASKLQGAKELLDKCATSGPAAVADPLLKDAQLKILPGKPQPPAAVITACTTTLKSVSADLDRVRKQIAKNAAKAPKKKK
ncbi:MAG: hypothetical protein QM723_11145 [Myxococcaceae bacterium]